LPGQGPMAMDPEDSAHMPCGHHLGPVASAQGAWRAAGGSTLSPERPRAARRDGSRSTSDSAVRSDGSNSMAKTFSTMKRRKAPRSVWSNTQKWKMRLMLDAQLDDLMVTPSEDEYKQDGWPQRIVRSQLLEWITCAVTLTNALWIGVDAEWNPEDLLMHAPAGFQVVEHFFCAYFVCEWVLRYMAFRSVRFAFKDSWFIFDSLLAILMVVETWVMTAVLLMMGAGRSVDNSAFMGVLSLLRLMRIARIARLLRTSPELLIMVKGVLAAIKSVMITLVLQLAVIYIFAVMMKQLAKDSVAGGKYFHSVFRSMYSLAVHATLLDSPATVLQDLGSESLLAAGVFFLVILVSSLVILNMLIGVLCEVVSSVSAVEKEVLAKALVTEKVLAVFEESGLDVDGDGHISKDELLQVLENETATNHLQAAGIDVRGLVDFADVIFQSDSVGREFERQLSVPDFVKLAFQLRGTNTATVKDFVDLRMFLHRGRTEYNCQMEQMDDRLKFIERLVMEIGGRSADMKGAPADAAGVAAKAVAPRLTPPALPVREGDLLLEEEIRALRAGLDASHGRLRELLPPPSGGLELRSDHVLPEASRCREDHLCPEGELEEDTRRRDVDGYREERGDRRDPEERDRPREPHAGTSPNEPALPHAVEHPMSNRPGHAAVDLPPQLGRNAF